MVSGVILVLFDPKPKEHLEELFDREEEVRMLRKSIRTPITLLLGVRRIGKTSILKSFLNSLSVPYIYLDLRILEEEGYSKVHLYQLLSNSITKCVSKWGKMVEYLRSIKGVSVSGFKVEFDWKEKSLMLSNVLDRLNDYALEKTGEGYIVISFDEAQVLRFLVGGKGKIDFRSLLAYAYDNYRGLRFILTGSEVGLLLDFLRLEDSASPLYGRFVSTVKVGRFTKDKSIEFLRRGFREANMVVGDEVLEDIVESVDGIVGWLTYFGYLCLESGNASKDTVKVVREKALKLVKKELENLFKRSSQYKRVLKALSLGASSWSGVKGAVEVWAGRRLSNAEITRFLFTLTKLGIIEKMDNEYRISDPLIAEYCKKV